jgi:signal transduction histidine kinase
MNIKAFSLGDWFALQPTDQETQKARLPRFIVWGVWLVCFAPITLNFLGVDFHSRSLPFHPENFNADTNIDTLYFTLTGSFTHTILEWSAFCTAIFTTVLAFIYFRIKKDVTTPVIAVALLCAGMMDAFHTLAADRLIEAVADNKDLIPFTWAICRLANALLTLIGVSFFLLLRRQKWLKSIYVNLGIGAFFCISSYAVISIAATSESLPKTTFPDALFTRPWDVLPLVIFLFAGVLIFPRFNKVYPSIFSHSLIIATIPNTMTQIHMAFGSTALFDNHFNIGHFLKIIAYVVPLTGLICDYYFTYKTIDLVNTNLNETIREQEETAAALRHSETLLMNKNSELNEAFDSLKKTQTQLIQTEKMSSLGQMVAGIAHEINNPVNFIHGNVIHLNDHMQELFELIDLYEQEIPHESEAIAELTEEIDLDFLRADLPKMLSSMRMGSERIREMVLSLRNFSRLDEADFKESDIYEGIESTLIILNNRLKNSVRLVKDYGKLPLVNCYPAQLNQVWMNLISNALDAMESLQSERKDYQPELTIRTTVIDGGRVEVAIADNGEGIDEETRQRIFDPFFTTKPIGKGTGLGLAIVYQIIEKHQGDIKLDSSPNEGTTFRVILPIKQFVVT